MLIFSSNAIAANWQYATSTKQEKFYIDKAFYNYNKTANTVEVWSKTETKTSPIYTSSKSLIQYDCKGKRSKTLAYIKYGSSGLVIQSSSNPSKFDIIFPDSVDEAIWEISCSTKGKGFKFIYYDYESEPVE